MMCSNGRPVIVLEADSDDLERWDQYTRRFPNHRVTHTRAWIESLQAADLGRALYLLFEKDGDVVGCLPGLLVSIGRWRLFGSPLPGWQTVSMGPAYDPARLSTHELLSALIPHLQDHHHVAHIELLDCNLDPSTMRAFGFDGQSVPTYRTSLSPKREGDTFRALKSNARRNIRRAERLGLVVRFETDEGFVDEHYDQLREVYRRGGHSIPFPKRRVLECFRHLHASGNLLAASVYLPGGINIATGMFLTDGRELLLWMWAHRLHYRWYRPTELMTWRTMQRAMRVGCIAFDLMGRGDFKKKFGAELDVSKQRWTRSRPRWLAVARRLAQTSFHCQQAVRGQTARLVERWAGAISGRRNGTARRRPAVACVLGDIDLVRALSLEQIPTAVVAPPGSPSRFSRFTHETLEWIDPWESPDALVDALLEYGAAQPEPPVLYYQEDRSLLLVSRHRERLREAFRFVVPERELVEQLVDKSRFQELARRLELPVPCAQSLVPSEIPDIGAVDLPFPIILKPLTRRPERWAPIAGRRKAIEIEGPEALRKVWPRLTAAGVPLLAQASVPGPETRIESYHVYVNGRGETVAEFTGRKIRTYPHAFGDSSAVEITQARDVTALGRTVVSRLGLRGVAKLDFKRGPDGQLHLLEVNPRFTLWHHVGAHAGVNIPALVYHDLLGRRHQTAAPARAGTRWCKVWTDHTAARDQGIPWHQWLSWMLSCEAKSGIAAADPFPLLMAGLWQRRFRPTPPSTRRVTRVGERTGRPHPSSP